jgi:hypothetical protein
MPKGEDFETVNKDEEEVAQAKGDLSLYLGREK